MDIFFTLGGGLGDASFSDALVPWAGSARQRRQTWADTRPAHGLGEEVAKREDRRCCICLINRPNSICLPCMHDGMCNSCARGIYRGGPSGRADPQCPICREPIAAIFDTRDKVHDGAAPPEADAAADVAATHASASQLAAQTREANELCWERAQRSDERTRARQQDTTSATGENAGDTPS